MPYKYEFYWTAAVMFHVHATISGFCLIKVVKISKTGDILNQFYWAIKTVM